MKRVVGWMPAFVLAGANAGCFPSEAAFPAPEVLDASSAPVEVRELWVFANLAPEQPALEDLLNQLQGAGIHVVRLPALPRDVEVTLAETRQVLHTTAEHRHHTTRHGVFEHIRRVLSVRSRDGLIDEMVFEWESDSLSPTGVSGLALGRALLASPRLASWARAPRRRAAEEEAEWIAEDEDFQRLDLKGCRQRHAEACPPIRAFVAKWPQGRRITDAKAALAKGEQ